VTKCSLLLCYPQCFASHHCPLKLNCISQPSPKRDFRWGPEIISIYGGSKRELDSSWFYRDKGWENFINANFHAILFIISIRTRYYIENKLFISYLEIVRRIKACVNLRIHPMMPQLCEIS
jgi:hypothetical protein